MCIGGTAFGRTITFAGLTWDVRTGTGNPGNNCWTDDTNSVFVDTAGDLHLRVRQLSDSRWCSVQLTAQSYATYGDHLFWTTSRLDTLASTMVFAGYLYADDNHEIDIEIARTFDPATTDPLWYTVQPYFQGAAPSNHHSPLVLTGANGDSYSSHHFVWSSNRSVAFASWYGHCLTAPCGGVIASWPYTGNNTPTHDWLLRPNISLWINGTHPATTQEVIVRTYIGPQIPKPAPTTAAANLIQQTSATLNGTVNPNGWSSVAWFEYGTTTAYSQTTQASSQSVGSGTSATSASTPVGSLQCNTTYHFRIVANNVAGTAYGSDATFTTTACPPAVTTNSATSIGASGATLNGTVNPNGASTTTSFDYGTTNSYGTVAPAQTRSGTTAQSISATIGGLNCGTQYHVRANGASSAGTTHGADVTFTTTACPPAVTTNAATAIVADGATLNGTVNPNGTSTATDFDYGPTAFYGTFVHAQTRSGSTVQSISATVSNLTCGALYHFRAVGTNAGGTVYGSDLTFNAACINPPAPPSGLTATAASPTRIDLSWTDASTNETAFILQRKSGPAGTYNDIATVGAGVTVYQDEGVSCGVQYFYRVRATNNGGDSTSSNEANAAVDCPSDTRAMLVFSRGGDIWKSKLDGSAPVQVTAGGGSSQPRLSDGVLVYANGGQLYRTDLSGTAPQAIPNSGSVYQFDLNPAGTRVALSYATNGTGTLYTMNIDGSALTPINAKGWYQLYPSWGRDGFIYFGQAANNQVLSQSIYRIPENGGSVTPVTGVFSQNPGAGGPGDKVAFTRTQAAPVLAVANGDGTAQSDVPSSDAGISVRTAYDAQTETIYYVFNGDVWSIHSDGTAKTRLTTTGGVDEVDYGFTSAAGIGIAAPAGLTATPASSTSIAVSWQSVPGAAYYMVQRSAGAGFMTIASPGETTFNDASAAPSTAYLYVVRAVDAATNVSVASDADLATTAVFTDDPIEAGVTSVKAVHLTELRDAVNAVRVLAAMPPIDFDDDVLAGGAIRSAHVAALRDGLAAARAALGLAAPSFTDPTLIPGASAIRAVHLQQIRDAVK